MTEKTVENMTYVELCEYYEGDAEVPGAPKKETDYTYGFAY